MKDELRRWKKVGVAATLVIATSLPLHLLKEKFSQKRPGEGEMPAAAYVGSAGCIECHREAFGKWQGSHHDLAMDFATDKTVLGDFSDVSFEFEGVASRFFRRDGRFFVNTEGPNGTMADFEIAYTFGAWPLQQYLVPFPGGRLQCLPIAWNAVAKRWYRLPPFDIDGPSDWLHWTSGGQTWNLMCAECHSTNLQKNYDNDDGIYETVWSGIDVDCEACHGAASLHVAWAEHPAMARPPLEHYGLALSTSDSSARSQVELCAPCHSRRMLLGPYRYGTADLLDSMVPEILTEGLYYADGQILEEVYVYGSFVQSRMYQQGIRCGDCHDVHSLKRLREGNELCLQCHRAEVYNTTDHHFHKKTHEGKPSDGWLCEKCHMPGRRYMGIDYRLDHSIRVPRPDLAIEFGLPSSCTMEGCHDDRSGEWSAEAYRTWYGIRVRPHYGTVIAAGRRGDLEARDELISLAGHRDFPTIVRATALSLLAGYPGNESARAIANALNDGESLVRYTALRLLNPLPPARIAELATPLLYDPVRAVRQQAGLALSRLGTEGPGGRHREFFDAALKDYRASNEYSADFAASQMNLGNLAARLGNHDDAEAHYLRAIAIDDRFYPAMNNLALLYNSRGRNGEAEGLLRRILVVQPEFHEASYSLGLLLAEEGRFEEAADFLERAAEGLPRRPRILYNLGLLQRQLQRIAEAEASLRRALEATPGDLDVLFALADLAVGEGRLDEARVLAVRILAIDSGNEAARELTNFLRREGRSREKPEQIQ